MAATSGLVWNSGMGHDRYEYYELKSWEESSERTSCFWRRYQLESQ